MLATFGQCVKGGMEHFKTDPRYTFSQQIYYCPKKKYFSILEQFGIEFIILK